MVISAIGILVERILNLDDSVRHEGAIDQRMKVPPEQLLVRLRSYPGHERGNPACGSLGDRRSPKGWMSKPAGRNASESRAGLEREVLDADPPERNTQGMGPVLQLWDTIDGLPFP